MGRGRLRSSPELAGQHMARYVFPAALPLKLMQYALPLPFSVFFTLDTLLAQPAPRPLTETLEECACFPEDLPEELTSSEVSAVWHADAEGFVIAFQRSHDSAALEVIVGSTPAEWTRATFETGEQGRDACSMIGGVYEIERKAGYLLVGRRVSPDGIATSILTPQLERIGCTYGRVFAFMPGNIVLYQRPSPRFGPTQYIGLAALDLDTGEERDVYPLPPHSPPRQQAIAIAKAEYEARGRQWCAEANHHCDPERFDNFVGWRGYEGTAVFDEAGGAIAIAVTLSPLLQNPGTPVVVTCSGATLPDIRCDEITLAEWQTALQTEEPAQVLSGAAADPMHFRR